MKTLLAAAPYAAYAAVILIGLWIADVVSDHSEIPLLISGIVACGGLVGLAKAAENRFRSSRDGRTAKS